MTDELAPPDQYYWEAASRQTLAYQQCPNCNAVQFPPRRICIQCKGDSLTWKVSAGEGVVHSHTTVYRAPRKEIATPYVIALVDLSEGFRMMVNLLDADIEAVNIGAPVHICFAPLADGKMLPQGRLKEGAR